MSLHYLSADQVHSTLKKHMLVDGYDFVLDTKKSVGSRLYEARTGKSYIDFFSFFASSPIGMNHPKLTTTEFREGMLEAATNNPSNSDIYTVIMAEFVDTFSRVGIPDTLPHLFLISGGALAVENALKTAFDWKVRKRFPKGFSSQAQEDAYVNSLKVIHFRQAFHGRSGYTLSLTNTLRDKIAYFPKFDWIRMDNPHQHFPMTPEKLEQLIRDENVVIEAIENALKKEEDKIACLLIEPIQAEGGDNHFRHEFLQALRNLCDRYEMMLIYDEVQTGVGLTGTFWAHQGLDVKPDILAFGKKMQVCGILASRRVDEVKDHVFELPSRINSTWGGNLADMFRSTWYLKIIEEEKLVDNAKVMGKYFLDQLQQLSHDFPQVTNPRGRGLMCAWDMPDKEKRDQFVNKAFEEGLFILKCGERSVRIRPALNISQSDIDEGFLIIRKVLKMM